MTRALQTRAEMLSWRPVLLTPQGFERQMATNHLGHAALVAALCDAADAD